MTIRCPNCRTEMPSDAAFCDQCGTRLSHPQPATPAASADFRCPRCGASATAGQSYCEQCGAALQPASPAPSAAQASCPECSYPVSQDDAFCTRCGQPLTHADVSQSESAQPDAVQGEVTQPSIPDTVEMTSPVSQAQLIVQGNITITIPSQPKVIVGREDPVQDHFPDIDLTPLGGSEQGVSRKHACIIRERGQYFIEDLGSINYTFVNQEKLKSGERRSLQSGDQLRFGRIVATFQIISADVAEA